ncbi:rho gtpase-activating protein 1-like isoform 2 [Stylonychia lemnae]|uniref:Rho gtpase-activating protein 1-like isoform 2 n=1 Tax=Stylonychia lemnae TaxID=5949 RepID=A0A078A7Q8_STYLE|nr:rho gtpase-activating protein 1-like isoform 2 [Stylonychia lemnae]|eukprot:CDW76821.1 rho gtpase-activating protein 1-like isoform 2 [Stylonychia lemnae]
MEQQFFDPILTLIDEVDSKLEEEHKCISISETKDSSMVVHITVEQNKQLYRNLSEKSKRTDDLSRSIVDRRIEAYQHLISKGALANLGILYIFIIELGANKDGVYYLVVYGSAYCKVQDANEKMRLTESFRTVVLSCWSLIYIHSGLGAFQKGALKTFKELYLDMDQEHKNKILGIYVIQPSKICDFVEYLRQNELDKSMYIKFIQQLPPSVSQIFQSELISQQKDYPELIQLTNSIINPNVDFQSPEFLKKYAQGPNELSTQSSNESLSSINNTHDVIGKNLSNIPQVFVQIYNYFDQDETRFKTKDLFKKQDIESLRLVDNLEQHISIGDYQYLNQMGDPTIVGCYFKSVLKYMEEPLCTYKGYKKFKKICERLYLDSIDKIIKHIQQVISEMEPVYQQTWKFILHFFFVITEHQASNKMNIKNLATIFSDIIFRQNELSSNDMVMWRVFTDLLCFMIRENHKIFRNSKQRKISLVSPEKSSSSVTIQSDDILSSQSSLPPGQ